MWTWLAACGPGPVEPPRAIAGAPGPVEPEEPAREEPRASVEPRPVVTDLPAGARARDWLLAGGGGTPEFNQVSIEQDLELARSVLAGEGLVLFAGGRGADGVQTLAQAGGEDVLLGQLADLFAPRGGRTSRYRPTTLAVDAAATADRVQAALAASVAEDAAPLLVYLAGHGQAATAPADTGIDLWGQTALRAVDVAGTLDGGARPVRLVVTSCFSGGFAELAFVGADAQAGRPARGRCGLFAATAEREASGCDPNPDRAAQEGYGLHFLNALRGRDREGKALARAELDVDGDGRISLLEAHTRARVASGGIDVPTTTSDRWLRARAAGLRGRSRPARLPEEDAVIAALSGELGSEASARAGLEQVQKDMSAATAEVERAGGDEDAAFRRTAGELLARWPVLDDPWHPDFAATLAGGRAAIAAHLAASEAYADYAAARAAGDAAREALGAALQRSARLERLVRAYETRALADRLQARGGADWRAYEALLACERWVPAVTE